MEGRDYSLGGLREEGRVVYNKREREREREILCVWGRGVGGGKTILLIPNVLASFQC